MKWKASDYNAPFQNWAPPKQIYLCDPSEVMALHALKNAFGPLPTYKDMEVEAINQNALVSIEGFPLPQGQIAFLENTAEKCTSPQTKHSQEGMRGARHWVQRVGTPTGMFTRLMDGYGISLMGGERCHQYIRNSNNWRGNFGCMLDLDVWYEQPETIQKKFLADGRDTDFIAKRLAQNEKRPKPVFSMQELFNRYPLLPRICSFLIPSASSLHEGRPFKARGVVLFPKVVTDQRVYRELGDILISELDCIPENVTKNPVAVGFGNTHNASQVYRSDAPDTAWIAKALETAELTVLSTAKQRKKGQKKKAKRTEHYRENGTPGGGENISEFISKCDPVSEMVKAGWLTPGRGNEYRWHESEHDRSCDILGGSIHIFSDSMFAASPHQKVNEAVGAHRFYLYQISGLDMTRDADKPRLREFLFDRGYGSDPKAFAKKLKHAQRHRTADAAPETITTLPPDAPIIAAAPTVDVREQSSYPHFSKEARTVVRDVLSLDPDAGWHGQIPFFTTRYEYLHPLTNKFALNGQPSEVEKRRVWSTRFGNCEICGDQTAKWIDRYLLTAGLYCDGCHKDYALGSYLGWELDRKLPNAIMSEYLGFLGDDPEFQDFRLWEPQLLTHLGAGMATGKSTEIYKAMIALAGQGLGKGIIAVPRVSLARFLAHYGRRRDGQRAWGLWHEGVLRSDRFIGKYGAIVCLPSLPRAIKQAEDDGVTQLHIAIDELDFSYSLLSLSIEQATAVKMCLRDALNITGLVVSGQTESTLALEAFAEEIGAEQVQGFYNTAKPADGAVVMQKHANVEGKSTALVCGAIDDISQLLDEGHNVYVFCSTRRDGDLIADAFENDTPVVYNAYTKGTARADAVLRNQGLTDSRLFIGTSAAGVGISILDKKARTVIVNGLTYGSREASMAVQKCVRDRGRCGVWFHYADDNLSLPVRPTENETVSLYHETVKQTVSKSAYLSSAGIRKIAYAQALNSLADMQIETFVEHHLGTVGNMSVSQASALPQETERIAAVSERRSEIRNQEKQKRIITAIALLREPYLLTSAEIRVLSNNGVLSPDSRRAHETANAAACAVGWDDKIHGYVNGEPIKDIPDPEALAVAILLVEKNINTDKLSKQCRGYFAVSAPKWTAHRLKEALEQSDAQWVSAGSGVEITAINDDRFLGRLLTTLLDRLTGEVFDSVSLATAVREVLNSPADTGPTFGSEIAAGALGASAYRNARFLHCSDDDFLIRWVRGFVSQWYPARIAKKDDAYALCHAEHLDLRRAAFSRWLLKQPGVPEGTQLDVSVFEATELPDHDADLKKNARFRREAGESITSIAEALDRHPNTVSKWCRGIQPPSPAQCEIFGILADGALWKTSDIVAHSRCARQNVMTTLKKLLDAGRIRKIKRGHYQKK